jgi:two-component system nitrogen regulation response regulator GlnG/two-component system response regulator HydG
MPLVSDTNTRTRDDSSREIATGDQRPALVIVWSAIPGRMGEALIAERAGSVQVFGRGGARDDDPHPRALLVRQRPGANEATPPLDDPFLSRVQLRLERQPSELIVVNQGKRPLLGPDGEPCDSCHVRPGDLVEIKGQVLFLCCTRPRTFPALRTAHIGKAHAFGRADEQGCVGESAATWALRDHIAFVAGRSAHVLLLGESGTGKEIVAQAIHALSSRSNKRLVARNAATLPEGIADAELFGNVANYPNAGMAERPGLVGEADGSTLFLDEIGELPEEIQTRLLRVLDERGEYQRLGDARRRTSALRLVGATNRPLASLRHDVGARLRLRLTVPPLDERREDIALLAAHLVRRIASDDPDATDRFMREGEPRISLELMRALLGHRYVAGVRELETLLWSSLSTSEGNVLELTSAVRVALESAPDTHDSPAARVRPRDLTEEDIRGALALAGGVQERAWKELGLANRYVLKRLVKKFGIRTTD